MSRYDRRSSKKDLRKLDPNSQEYWDEVLAREGLSMERGNNRHRLTYVGDSQDLAHIVDAQMSERAGCGGGRRTGRKPTADEQS